MRPQPKALDRDKIHPGAHRASPGPVPAPRIFPLLYLRRGARSPSLQEPGLHGSLFQRSHSSRLHPNLHPLLGPAPSAGSLPLGTRAGLQPSLSHFQDLRSGITGEWGPFHSGQGAMSTPPRRTLLLPCWFCPQQLQGPAQQGRSGQGRQMDAGKPEAPLPGPASPLRAWERGPQRSLACCRAGRPELQSPSGPDSTQEKARAAFLWRSCPTPTPGLQCPQVSPSPSKGLCNSGKGKQMRGKGMGARRQKKSAPSSHKGRGERARTSKQAAVPQ